MRKNGKKQKYTIPFIAGILFGVVVILIVSILIESYNSSEIWKLNNRITKLESNRGNVIPKSDYEGVIEFLKNESIQHRQFIESQRQHLVWLIAFLGAILTFALSFTGFASRRKVDNMIRETYSLYIENKFNKELKKLVKGESIDHLTQTVVREANAKRKKILFLQQSGGNNMSARDGIFDYMEQSGYQIRRETVDIGQKMDSELKAKLRSEDILVYEVANDEIERIGDTLTYKDLLCFCEIEKIFCILYTPIYIPDMNPFETFYVSMANTGITVIERLQSILNI